MQSVNGLIGMRETKIKRDMNIRVVDIAEQGTKIRG